jgi:hypothetical protein
MHRRMALGRSAGNHLTTDSSPWLSLVAPRSHVN